jgi:Flp pilus assembly protein TadG
VFRRSGSDDGTILLMLGFVVVFLVGLITVVVNATKVYLEQTSLYAAADAAAASAANQLDYREFIQDNSRANLPVNEARARAAVLDYAADAELVTKFHDFRVVALSVQGTTASVTFQARVPMPFIGYVAGKYRGGAPITATSNAQLPADRQ